MSSHVDTAAAEFSEGFNCAQAVFSTYAPLLGVKREDALRIATGFGAGMGRTQETCGAVTGAYMVIGCKHGMRDPGETAEKEAAYTLVREFAEEFRRRHRTTSCRELLGCDMTTEEGKKTMRERNLTSTVCLACVRDASAILEDLLFRGGR